MSNALKVKALATLATIQLIFFKVKVILSSISIM